MNFKTFSAAASVQAPAAATSNATAVNQREWRFIESSPFSWFG
jgi:hypothetical protein